MGRPLKQGLDYFPFDIDFFSDEKVSAISGEFGIKGEIATIKLLCAVYRSGYFVEWNEMLEMKLLKELPGVSIELLRQIVAKLVKWGFFDKNLFDTFGVLTSRGIQKRFFAIAYRRIMDKNNLPYVINDSRNIVIDNRNSPANDLLLSKSAQSKVKESKEKKETDFVGKEKSPSSQEVLSKKNYGLRNLCRPFEKNVEECLQDKAWQEGVLINLNLKKEIDWNKALLSFRANLVANGYELKKSRADFRQHFTNWLRIQLNEQKKQQNGEENMAGNDRSGARDGFGKPRIAPATVVPEGRGKSCL